MAKKEEDILKKLTKAMEEVQTGKRFQHTLGVEFTCAALAMKHDAPIFQAQLAGLLHDCAKCMEDEKLLKICEKRVCRFLRWKGAIPICYMVRLAPISQRIRTI